MYFIRISPFHNRDRLNKLHLLNEDTPTIQDAIVNQDFRSAILPLSENVDIIPNGKDLDGIDIFLYKMLGDENHPAFNFYLRKLGGH